MADPSEPNPPLSHISAGDQIMAASRQYSVSYYLFFFNLFVTAFA